MKILIVALLFLASCNDPGQMDVPLKPGEVKDPITGQETTFTIITVDSCQYVAGRTYYGLAICHHENCNNSKHKAK